MSITTIFLIAAALAMDAFAVAVTAGFQIRTLSWRHIFRLSWHFGLFQAVMPVIGWFSGQAVVIYIEKYDHWAAFFLLLWIGGNMIRESFAADTDKNWKDPTKGMRLVVLSVATSIDALAVGFTLAALNIPILLPAVIIGCVAFLFTCTGLIMGHGFLSSGKFGKKAELLGGTVLILIGIKILSEHNVF